MAKINILDQNTINQIAAGEVIERPASVVKELIENAIDAGSDAITCEIKGGGIEMIRVTDNGCGIEPSEIRKAFTSHATSKIRTAADLIDVMSLGFRGEALASIASVAEVEVLTKLAGEVMGTRYVVCCGEERTLSDAGCPEGTTIIVKQLFSGVPVRRKFLKSPITEASYVSDLIEKIALSHPEVSIRYINNGKTVIFTKGNNKTDEVIYGIYGRDVTSSLIELKDDAGAGESNDIRITGFIAKPVVTRSNRGMEHYFVNGRYIRNNVISKAIEEAYAPYMMQHKYPFTVLNIRLDAEKADVNVHPSKQEIRFQQPQDIFNAVYSAVSKALKQALMIPEPDTFGKDTQKDARNRILADQSVQRSPEPFEKKAPSALYSLNGQGSEKELYFPGYVCEESRDASSAHDHQESISGNSSLNNISYNVTGNHSSVYEGKEQGTGNHSSVYEGKEQGTGNHTYGTEGAEQGTGNHSYGSENTVQTTGNHSYGTENTVQATGNHSYCTENIEPGTGNISTVNSEHNPVTETVSSASSMGNTDTSSSQLRFTLGGEDKDILNGFRPETSEDFRKGLNEGYRIIGQVFATYWIVEKADRMYMIDQHAAHEKIIYERICAQNAETVFDSQMLSPSMILSFTPPECACIEEHIEDFRSMGFELEHFSGTEYHLSSVPMMLYSIAPEELIREIVDSFMSVNPGVSPAMYKNVSHSMTLKDRLATCSCKAAVKGNTKLSYDEAKKLIEDLLKLDNPFNCPHGRPVIIEMTKQELEKKFKRII